MHDMESYDYRENYRDEYGRNQRENYREDYRDDYGRNMRDYRDDYRRGNYRNNYMGNYRNYRDEYGRNRRNYRGNYRSEEYTMMLEDIVGDNMELARAYEDVSEMATDSNERQKLMKIAEREKEHYRYAKEMLEKHM